MRPEKLAAWRALRERYGNRDESVVVVRQGGVARCVYRISVSLAEAAPAPNTSRSALITQCLNPSGTERLRP